MADAPQVVTGFNHTVKHGGKAFHVQSEDSGASRPRVVTHLFLGGNVLASKRTDYALLLGASDLPRLVRELMEQQHKDVLRNLVAGVYDDARASEAVAWQPGELDAANGPLSPAPIAMHPRAAPPAPGAEAPAPAAPEALAPGPVEAALAEPPPPTAEEQDLVAAPVPPPEPVPTEASPPEERSLDELILSYLAEDFRPRGG